MGWKNVKEHYGIEHTVEMRQENLLIGSPYVHDLLTVKPDGSVKRNSIVKGDGELGRIERAITSDPARFMALMESPDSFGPLLPVYTYMDGEIIEEQCEVYEYPNMTVLGNVQYENTYFADKNEAVRRALRSLRYRIESTAERVEEAQKELERRLEYQRQANAAYNRLCADYPEIAAVIEPDEDD